MTDAMLPSMGYTRVFLWDCESIEDLGIVTSFDTNWKTKQRSDKDGN